MRNASTLVDACDPDREGSGIFRRIVRQAGLMGKPAMRLWTNSMDADGIRTAWKRMKPETETSGLADASDARAKADWITGMTASRAYTLLYNRRCSIGRVETPTLAMIVDRDRQISGHIPTPFWTITVPLDGWTLTSERITDETQADGLLARIGGQITIGKVERRQLRQSAPHLYSLTDLQRDANTEKGLTAVQTLEALQALYEAGLATYPRTDSRYITSDDETALKQLLEDPLLADPRLTGNIAGNPDAADASQVVDNGKVEGHTALLPTDKITVEKWEALADQERTVLGLIIRRTWQATGSPRIHESVKATAEIDGHRLTATQDTTIDPGWTAYKPGDGTEGKQHIPDGLTDGQTVLVTGPAEKRHGETEPPKPYTDASLLSAMEHAGRLVQDKELRDAIDDDSVHSGGLGTPATRAGIIDKLIKRGYAERKGRQILSTEEGRIIVSIVAPGLKSVETTGRMEQGLTDIAEGRLSEDKWMDRIHKQAGSILTDAQSSFKPEYKTEEQNRMTENETFGPCPACGKPVIKTRNGYWKCSDNKSVKGPDGKWTPAPGACRYGIWKKTVGNNRKRLTNSLVRKTLNNEKPVVKAAFHSNRTGKDYDLILVPDQKWGIDGKFPERNNGKK